MHREKNSTFADAPFIAEPGQASAPRRPSRGEWALHGDEFALAKAQPIRIKVRGTRAIARVAVIKVNRVVYSAEPGQQNVELEYTDRDGVAGRHFDYVRVQQDDQLLAW